MGEQDRIEGRFNCVLLGGAVTVLYTQHKVYSEVKKWLEIIEYIKQHTNK